MQEWRIDCMEKSNKKPLVKEQTSQSIDKSQISVGKVILNFLKEYKHAWLLLYAFIYLPWFAYLERTVIKYHSVHIFLDDYIPFEEIFIIPYLMWFGYVAIGIAYFFFTNKKDYYKICSFLFIGMTISLIICTIWPNGQDLRPVVLERENVFTSLIQGLYKTDTNTNVFPSVHVYNSIGVHIAVMHSEALRNKKWIRRGSFVLMILICLSTVFLKQHSILDGIGAIALSMIMYKLVYGMGHSLEKKELKEQLDL